MNIHFTGIGGIGMSALAQLCVQRGDTVTGSDTTPNPITNILESEGIHITFEQTKENITDNIDLLIYTEAVHEDNPERQEARLKNIPQKSYFEYLGEISKDYQTVAIAGTHGKTTTTGLLASAMIKAELDPTVIVGAQLPLLNDKNYRHGKSDWLIVEACEYRENFRFLKPEIVLITNVELDHVDYYQSEQHYIEAFQKFVKNAQTVVAHPNTPLIDQVLKGYEGAILWTNSSIKLNLNIIGKHNHDNALLCEKLLEILPLTQTEEGNFYYGLEQFKGSARRQERIGASEEIEIYDDYGHHPTEIEATYKAFQENFPKKTIGLLFEPHQYSRTKELFEDFANILQNTKPLGLLPIYEARDTDQDKQSVSIEKLAQACNGEIIRSQEEAKKFMQKHLKKGDILLCMGAGNISSFARELIK